MSPNIKNILGSVLLGSLISVGAHAQSTTTLDKIKQAGVLKVGVKTDYRPFGFLDSDGKIMGLEPDLASDMAARLGVKLELVPVQAANRMEFLQQGRIDLMIATMSVNDQRRRAIGVIEPFYYAGGTAVILKKGSNITSWEDLKNRKICGMQGAYYNRNVAQKYGVQIVAFPGATEGQSALLTGSCEGYLQDSTLLAAMLADPTGLWNDYEMPLPTEDFQPWAVAVAKDEQNTAWGEYVQKAVTEWHQSGALLKAEEKWGLAQSEFTQEQHEKYKVK